ncbi:MAG: hypothetical protein JW941_10085 [Candidatus Coatesbacteria bacterium]|nr:hypothetical protein [Candidatus Coatesbacteria bacterium]
MDVLIAEFSDLVTLIFGTIPFRDIICLIFIVVTFAFVVKALRTKGLSRDARRWWRYFLVVTSLFFASELFRTGRLFAQPESGISDIFYLLTYVTMALGCIMLLALIFWSHRRLNIFQ